MNKLQIKISKDFTLAERNLKGIQLTLYKKGCEGAFIVVRGLFNFIDESFKEENNNDEIILSMENETLSVLEKEKETIEHFLMDSVNVIRKANAEKFNKLDALMNSNRILSKFYNWTKKNIEDQALKNSVTAYLMSVSIFVSVTLSSHD